MSRVQRYTLKEFHFIRDIRHPEVIFGRIDDADRLLSSQFFYLAMSYRAPLTRVIPEQFIDNDPIDTLTISV